MALYALGRVVDQFFNRSVGGSAENDRYLPEKRHAELPGFDLVETLQHIMLKNGLTGVEKRINPYEMMHEFLQASEAPVGVDELELQELCGFFGLNVQEFKSAFLEFVPADAFVNMLRNRASIEVGEEEYLFSAKDCQMIDARREAFTAMRRG